MQFADDTNPSDEFTKVNADSIKMNTTDYDSGLNVPGNL